MSFTTERCLDFLDDRNRYRLVILAAQRARHIYSGAEVHVDSKCSSKDHFMALDEIARGKIDLIKLNDDVMQYYGVQGEGNGNVVSDSNSVLSSDEAMELFDDIEISDDSNLASVVVAGTESNESVVDLFEEDEEIFDEVTEENEFDDRG